MHSGTNNMNFCLKLGPHHLEMTEQERNLFLLICHRGTVSCQHHAALRKANVLVPGNAFPLGMGQYLCHVPAHVQEDIPPPLLKNKEWKLRKGPNGLRGKA